MSNLNGLRRLSESVMGTKSIAEADAVQQVDFTLKQIERLSSRIPLYQPRALVGSPQQRRLKLKELDDLIDAAQKAKELIADIQ